MGLARGDDRDNGGGGAVPDNIERQTVAMRNLYAPLFRKHHVRITITGHDHLYDHWVERYTEAGICYRRDDLVTGGRGATITTGGSRILPGDLGRGRGEQYPCAST